MLKIKNLETFYGSVHVLKSVSLNIDEGKIVTVIGANGAGKTTLLMSIFGTPEPKSGEILFRGKPITNTPTHHLSQMGIQLCPEGRRIFQKMSVYENLQMGAFVQQSNQNFQNDLNDVYDLFPLLKERRNQIAGTLSGGEQQMLAISRSLMGRPRLLILDEPSLGLAPLVVKKIFDVITRLNQERKMTIFLVEQNAFHALKLAHKGYVLVNGMISMEDTGDNLLSNPQVKKAYLYG